MKILALLCLSLAVSCSPARQTASAEGAPGAASPSPGAAPTQQSVNAEGEPYGLRFENGILAFCDARGGRKLDLKTGVASAATLTCKKEEPNTACSGLPLDVSVRAQLSEPNDIVDLAGESFPMKGRVHDCAAVGKTIAVVTGSSVALIVLANGANGAVVEISPQGGDRVAVGAEWVAWTDGSKVNAALLSALKKSRPSPSK